MTASVQGFRSYLNQFTDIAKADRFTVFVSPPTKLTGYNNAMRNLSFQCEVAELPGRTFQPFTARTYGPTYSYPRESTYSDLNLTFLCMANYVGSTSNGIWEKSFFDDWMELIQPSTQTRKTGAWNLEYQDNYVAPVKIIHYDNFDNPTYIVEFIDTWPQAVTPMGLSWNDDSQLKLQVSFAYKSWKRTSASSPAFGGMLSSITTAIEQIGADLVHNIEQRAENAINSRLNTTAGQTIF